MSDYYAEKNTESTRDLFQKRYIYRDTIVNSSTLKNIVNFNLGEKYFYGRVNRVFIPMEPAIKVKAFKDPSTTGAPITALPFVVDAFTALSTQFNKCVLTGKISASDPNLSSLRVYKGYTPPRDAYGQYLEIVKGTIKKQFVANKTILYNFDDFIRELMNIVKIVTMNFPFTMPAYVKSKYCSIASSGLAVEIAADKDAANDNNKITEFVNSPTWQFYVNACNTYGFMIDEFVPWRLVADIGSAPMVEFAAQYRGLYSTNNILNRAYQNVHLGYYAKFKYYILNLYNYVKAQAYVVTEQCNGVTRTDIVTPPQYTMQQLNQHYNEDYFLRLYCQIRFYEEPSFFDEGSQYRLIDDTLEVVRARGLRRGLDDFERIINKPFDYRGSLSYIKKYLDALADAEGP